MHLRGYDLFVAAAGTRDENIRGDIFSFSFVRAR